MKIVVTGANGFVGKHLIDLLKQENSNEVTGLDRTQADITDYEQVKKFIEETEPDQVYHLAGFASVAGKDKDLIFKVNVEGTENILKALSELNKSVNILLASTAYVYGNTNTCADESGKIDAKSFYDQSKLEMEKISKKYQNDNIRIVITRATNHTGPGQKVQAVVGYFCDEISKAKNVDTIKVGNLAARRDMFDVRDCVKAYKIVMEKGEYGEIYNIGTGNPITIEEVLEKIIKISGKNIKHEPDLTRLRPSDIPQNCVDSTKIRSLGWEPEITLDKTLEATYKYFESMKG